MGVKQSVARRKNRERHQVKGRIHRLALLLGVIGLFRESFRVQLAGQVFDGGNDARSGAIHRVTDHRVTVIANGTHNFPPRKRCELRHLARGISGMRLSKYQKIRLQTSDFFEVHLGPTLRRIYDGNGSGMAKSVGEKSVFAGGDEWLRPNNKENALGGQAADALLEIVETMLHFLGNRDADLRDTEHNGQCLYRRDDIRDGVRIGGVGGDSQSVERLHRFEAIEGFGDENKIRMEGSNHLQARVDSAADLGLFLCVGRVVAIFGVTHEAILQAERVDGFRQAGSQGNDAANRLRDANAATRLIDDFAKSGRLGGRRSGGALRACWSSSAGKNDQGCASHGMKTRERQFLQTVPHDSGEIFPKNEKAPRDARGLPASPFLAKSAGLCAKGGWPGLRLLEPITVAGPRPIRTAFPASPAANWKFSVSRA